MDQANNDSNSRIPAAGHGKMPKWLFFIWVVLVVWGIYYLVRYALPDLREFSKKPLPTAVERGE